MRTVLYAALVVGLTALTANAAIITNPALGALQMTLTIDPAGNATLMNNTGANLNMDSYEIWSATNSLDPTDGTGWRSIKDWVAVDPVGVMAKLGAGALTFGELAATTGLLSEGNLSSHAVLLPTDPFSIRKPLNPGTPTSDLTFYYTKPSVVGDKFLGLIVPEPATLGLLALSGLALLKRRRG